MPCGQSHIKTRGILSMERWTPAVGYEGYYSVSSEGRVKRTRPECGTRPRRFLAPIRKRDGYLCVRLYGENRAWETVTIHRLVARSFLGEPPTPKHEVNHKDGRRDNNSVDNLEWVTRSENLTHAIRVLHRTQPRGERHGMSRLTEESVREIRRIYAAGEAGQVALAKRFNVTQTTVWRVLNGGGWAHVGDR